MSCDRVPFVENITLQTKTYLSLDCLDNLGTGRRDKLIACDRRIGHSILNNGFVHWSNVFQEVQASKASIHS
jgi:hypothetical protein